MWCAIYQNNYQITDIAIKLDIDIALADFNIYQNDDNYQNIIKYSDKSTAFSSYVSRIVQ